MERREFEKELVALQGEMTQWARRLAYLEYEDIVQTTNLRAIEKMDKFVGGNIKAWLYVMMRRVCIDAQLKRNETTADYIEHVNDNGLEVFDIQDAIGRLPCKMRRTMTLYICGYTTSEIAQKERCAEGTVSSRVSNAKKKIRRVLYG